MRAGGNDTLEFICPIVPIEHGYVCVGKLQEEVFVTRAARRVAGTSLLVTQDGEIHLGLSHERHECFRHSLGSPVVARGTTDPIQYLYASNVRDATHTQILAQSERAFRARFQGLPLCSIPSKLRWSPVGTSPRIRTRSRRIATILSK